MMLSETKQRQHVSGLKFKKAVLPEVHFIFWDLLTVEYKTALSPTQNDKTPSDVSKVHKSVMIVDLVGGFNPSQKICSSKCSSSPSRDENTKMFELPPPRDASDAPNVWIYHDLPTRGW